VYNEEINGVKAIIEKNYQTTSKHCKAMYETNVMGAHGKQADKKAWDVYNQDRQYINKHAKVKHIQNIPANILNMNNIEATGSVLKKNPPIPYPSTSSKYLELPLLDRMKWKGKVISYYNTAHETSEEETANTPEKKHYTRKGREAKATSDSKKVDLMICWNCVRKWLRDPNVVVWTNMDVKQVQTLLEQAAANGGPIEIWDNTSYFLLHQFQQHWMPELYSMLASLHTRTVLDNTRIQLNRLANSINKGVTHYKYPCSSYLLSDHDVDEIDQPILWPKAEIKQMAEQNFIEPFKQWQSIGERKFGEDNIVFYDNVPAETGCKQVVIWSLSDLNVHPSVEKRHSGERDWNFEDVQASYGYEQCFTQDVDFNYTHKSFLNRAKYTQEAFDDVQQYNPNFWGDWNGSYMDMLEECMVMSKIMREMLEEKIVNANGDTLIRPAGEVLAYKRARASDAYANWDVYHRIKSLGYLDTSSDGIDYDVTPMDLGVEDATGAHAPSQNAPLHESLSLSADANASNYPHAADDTAIGLSNATSDMVPAVQYGANVNPILPTPQQGASGKVDQSDSPTTDVMNKPNNACNVYFGGDDVIMQQYDNPMAQEYVRRYGKEEGTKRFTEYQETRHNVMIDYWKRDMMKAVPLIAKDPALHKAILAANPSYAAATLKALIEDWDDLWKSMSKEDLYLYESLKKSLFEKFAQDEHYLANNTLRTGNQEEMYGEISANPALRDDTTPPDQGVQQAEEVQQQSDAEPNILP